MTQQETCGTPDCRKRATYEVRHVERGVIGHYCTEHKGEREGGYAPFKIDAAQCSAEMPDGLPCNRPARFVVTRPFSGIESICCGIHQPKQLHIRTGAVKVSAIGGVGA